MSGVAASGAGMEIEVGEGDVGRVEVRGCGDGEEQ